MNFCNCCLQGTHLNGGLIREPKAGTSMNPEEGQPISANLEPGQCIQVEESLSRGLSMMSRAKVAAADTAALSREQAAFLNKYGMTMSSVTGEGAAPHQRDSLLNYLNWEYLKDKFVIDPSKDHYYYWTGIVSLAYLYNLLVL
uniref:Uncharacterized protein n=1 Tax=Ditylenchus dipsaci TaxID=166011 RepID=A0A915EIA1_9BILA